MVLVPGGRACTVPTTLYPHAWPPPKEPRHCTGESLPWRRKEPPHSDTACYPCIRCVRRGRKGQAVYDLVYVWCLRCRALLTGVFRGCYLCIVVCVSRVCGFVLFLCVGVCRRVDRCVDCVGRVCKCVEGR